MFAAQTIAVAIAAALDPRPPASDLYNFPPAAVCRERMESLAAYRLFLDARASFFPGQAYSYRQAAADASAAWSAWDWLLWAHTRESDGCRRAALDNLRRLLGPAAYYAGRMP